MKWAIITGEYPPQPGGVSDYTRFVAHQLALRGDRVTVYSSGYGASTSINDTQSDGNLVIRSLPGHFGLSAISTLDHELSSDHYDRILVQYVPHAFGWKAMNLAFATWLSARAWRFAPVWLMIHELHFPFSWFPIRHAVLSSVTQIMARLVLKSASRVFVSILQWCNAIAKLIPTQRAPEWLPIPSNITPNNNPTHTNSIRNRLGGCIIGHFGTYGSAITTMLTPVLTELCARKSGASILLIGRGSEDYTSRLVASNPAFQSRLFYADSLTEENVSSHLTACDLMIQPYPDGVSARRTSLMAGLSHSIPVVTNLGNLSESFWGSQTGVTSVPSQLPFDIVEAAITVLRLSPNERQSLGHAGLKFYQQYFSIDRVITALTQL